MLTQLLLPFLLLAICAIHLNKCTDTLYYIIIQFSPLVTDDSMTIMMAFQTPEIELLGLTTIFGNVSTENATCNALLLVRIFPQLLFCILEYGFFCPV